MLVDIPAAQHNTIFFITTPAGFENIFHTLAVLRSMYENYFHECDRRWILVLRRVQDGWSVIWLKKIMIIAVKAQEKGIGLSEEIEKYFQ